MPKIFLRLLAAGVVLAGVSSAARADVRLPAIIGDNMVLQAGVPVPIWGWALPDEQVTVTLGEATATTKADTNGKWRVELPAQKTSASAVQMRIAGRNPQPIMVRNILVGDVWLGSGQSNMEWSVQSSTNSREEIAAADHPQIRLFVVSRRFSGVPLDDVQGRWAVCSPQSVGPSSGVLYFFGREIQKTLNIPVGLITTAVGGSQIYPWIPAETFSERSDLSRELDAYKKGMADRSVDRLKHAEALKAWIAESEKASAEGRPLTDPPTFSSDKGAAFGSPTAMFNGMVHGILPFPVKGFLWYQGEANRAEGMHYADAMKALISSWRKLWNAPEAPFLYVQLAPYRYRDPDGTRLPLCWEAQTSVLEVPNTGMAVTTDLVDNIADIHPKNKQDVGKRLALWALAKTYGKSDLVYSGPLYESMAVEGNKIRLKFKHTGTGLWSRDGQQLTWFTVAGEDKTFHKAEATIDGNTVVVSSPAVSSPVAVRFGWNELAEPNLSNKEKLPASPFRTDKWSDAKNAEQ